MSLPKDAYLAHHGILGQKWGKKNGPPYPLGYNDHSSSEKKAGWEDSLVSYGSESKRTKKLRENAEYYDRVLEYDKKAGKGNEFEPYKETIEKKHGEAHKKLETSKQKDKAKGLTGEPDETELRMKKHPTNADVDMKKVNSGPSRNFKTLYDPGVTMNCMNCTAAYELRRRGYDVVAKKAIQGHDVEYIQKCFPGAELKPLHGYNSKKGSETSYLRAALGQNKELASAVEKKLLKEGNGARGSLLMRYGKRSGHSVNYEVTDGKLILRDCQTGTKYSNASELLRYSASAYSMRLDNVDFDTKKIKEAVE